MSGTEPSESNPNAAGPQGLQGDMGVSSERTGPLGGSDPADEDIQGTGTRGSAAQNTEGTMSTERQQPEEPAEDDTASIESNPAEVPSHDFDRTKNPGHSHG